MEGTVLKKLNKMLLDKADCFRKLLLFLSDIPKSWNEARRWCAFWRVLQKKSKQNRTKDCALNKIFSTLFNKKQTLILFVYIL